MDSAWTDSLGVAVVKVATDSVRISVQAASAVALSGQVAPGDSVKLAPLPGFRIQGRFAGASAFPTMAILYGTPYATSVGGDGSFAFTDVPLGQYDLVSSTPSTGSVSHKLFATGKSLALSADLLDVQAPYDSSGVLVDDFSDGDGVDNLCAILGVGYWWIGSPAPLAVPASPSQALAFDGVSHYFSFAANVPTASTGNWVSFGVNIGKGSGNGMLTHSLAGVRLRVRGSGTWVVKLVSVMDTAWEANLQPGAQWQDITLRESDFTPVALPAGTTWANSTATISKLVLQTDQAGAIDLGAMTLLGVTLLDFNQNGK